MTLIVSPETEARLSVIAARRGILPDAALELLVDEALDDQAHAVGPSAGIGTDRPLPVYDPAALVAILDSFNTGDAEASQIAVRRRPLVAKLPLNVHKPAAKRLFWVKAGTAWPSPCARR